MSDLDIGELNSNQSYSGLVDPNAAFNLVQLELSGKVGVSLTGLTANTDLQIIDNSDKMW